jgi:hypothetical protein
MQVHFVRRLGRTVRHLDLRRHPELALFPSEQHGRKAMRRAARKLVGRPAHLVAAVAAAALSVTSTLVLRKLVASLGLPISQLTRDLILAVPVIIVCCVLGLWLLNRHISKLLRYELLDCGVPICVRCGYHLIGLAGPNCPECGRPFDAHVRRILETDKSQPAPE